MKCGCCCCCYVRVACLKGGHIFFFFFEGDIKFGFGFTTATGGDIHGWRTHGYYSLKYICCCFFVLVVVSVIILKEKIV